MFGGYFSEGPGSVTCKPKFEMLLQGQYVHAHLLGGEPDFDLPWDLDLQ